MEEVYSDKQQRTSEVAELSWPSTSSKFLSQGSHQHQRALMPLLSSGVHNMPHTQSRFCKEFMDEKFGEVRRK